MANKLRIVPGAGSGYEVDADVARQYHGPVDQVLRRIIDEHIRDPELRGTLEDPRLAIDQFTQGDGGAQHEQPVAPTTDWSRILQQLEQGNVELGVARAHTGGADLPGPAGAARASAAATPAASLRDSPAAPCQAILELPEGYQLTDQDRQAVAEGAAVFLTSKALALAEGLCRLANTREVIWYWISSSQDYPLITGVMIPEQEGSSGHVEADARSVLRASRQARQEGRAIISAGHSHGGMAVFTSLTDRQQLQQLAAERVGFARVVEERLEGQLPPAAPSADGLAQNSARFDITVPGAPDLKLALTAPAGTVAEGATLQVQRARRMDLVTYFSTHNLWGDVHFPAFLTTRCPSCGSRLGEPRLSEEVAVHVIGRRRDLTREERQWLHEEFRRKVRPYGGHYYSDPSPSYAVELATTDLDAASAPAVPLTPSADDDPAPPNYQLYRRGQFVGTVPPAVLEEAAAKVPALAKILGWTEAGAER
jgi:hypothetical protein